MVGLAVAATCPAVAVAATISIESESEGGVTIRAVGCGVTASVTVPLPAGASNVQVRLPRVGTTRTSSRITEAAVAGTDLRVSAIGEGQETCDPASDPDVPPAQRQWSDVYTWRVSFRESVSVGYRRPESSQRRPVQRPSRVLIPRVANGVGIRWQSFGGRRAVGFGRIRAIPGPGIRCSPRQCPGHGARMRVVLSRPVRCPELGAAVFYDRTTIYMEERARFLRKGELFSFANSGCPSGRRPARV